MFAFKPLNASLILVPLVLISGYTEMANAQKDVRFYVNNNCSGSFLVCTGLQGGQCCRTSNRAASVQVSPPNNVARTQAFGDQICNDPASSQAGAGCLRAPFVIGSGRWFSPGSLQRKAEEGAKLDCAEVDSVGYFDVALNKTVEYRMSEGNRKLLIDAATHGRIHTLKANAPSN